MAKVTYTGSSAVKLKKPKYIVGTLFTGAETDDTPLGDSYVFEDIERDTTSVSQDENDSSDIERETSDTPIDSIVTLGAWQVSAELDDLNTDLLVALMGFFKDSNGNVCAPSSYSDRYIKFEVVYEDPADSTKLIAMCVPKLKLNARVVLESMNSDLGNLTIAGTAQNIKVTDSEGNSKDTPFMVVSNYTLPVQSVTYTAVGPETLIVNSTENPAVGDAASPNGTFTFDSSAEGGLASKTVTVENGKITSIA